MAIIQSAYSNEVSAVPAIPGVHSMIGVFNDHTLRIWAHGDHDATVQTVASGLPANMKGARMHGGRIYYGKVVSGTLRLMSNNSAWTDEQQVADTGANEESDNKGYFIDAITTANGTWLLLNGAAAFHRVKSDGTGLVSITDGSGGGWYSQCVFGDSEDEFFGLIINSGYWGIGKWQKSGGTWSRVAFIRYGAANNQWNEPDRITYSPGQATVWARRSGQIRSYPSTLANETVTTLASSGANVGLLADDILGGILTMQTSAPLGQFNFYLYGETVPEEEDISINNSYRDFARIQA